MRERNEDRFARLARKPDRELEDLLAKTLDDELAEWLADELEGRRQYRAEAQERYDDFWGSGPADAWWEAR